VNVGILTVTYCEYPGGSRQVYPPFTKLEYSFNPAVDEALNVIISKFGTLALFHSIPAYDTE
jgi:hypothetical protein